MPGTDDPPPQVLRLRRRVRRAHFAQEAYQRPAYDVARARACAVIMLGVPAVLLSSCVVLWVAGAVANDLLPWQQVQTATLSVAGPVCGTWQARVERADIRGLNAIAAVSPSDIWVGGDGDQGALIQHWDGSTWHTVGAPDPFGSGDAWLTGMAAVSAHDIWATGNVDNIPANQHYSFILHWDGVGWKHVPSPNPGPDYNQLNAIVALSRDDVWAVGESQEKLTGRGCNGCGSHALIVHWDGTTWSRISDLYPVVWDASLQAIAALAPNDIWAVGSYGTDVNDDPYRTLTVHWDGTKWSTVSSPSPGSSNILRGIAAVSSDDIWAVGAYSGDKVLLLHWNGKVWSQVAGPDRFPGHYSELSGVTALSKDDIWAVGGFNKNNIPKQRALVMHWDGTRWSEVPSPQPKDDQYLNAVAAVSQGDILAVGGAGNNNCDFVACPHTHAIMVRLARASCPAPTAMTR